FLASIMILGYKNPKATTGASPIIDREKTILHVGKKQLVIVGENFDTGVSVQMESNRGILAKGQMNIEGSNTIVIDGVEKSDFPDGVATITVRNSAGVEVKEKLAVIPSAIGPSPLTVSNIKQILAQAVAACRALNKKGTFAILDREGNI